MFDDQAAAQQAYQGRCFGERPRFDVHNDLGSIVNYQPKSVSVRDHQHLPFMRA